MMSLNDRTPLSHFRELSIFPRVLLLLGFIFLGFGAAHGLSPYNRTVVLALVIIALSLATHYFSDWSNAIVDGRTSVKWWNLVRGVLILGISLVLLWWLVLPQLEMERAFFR
jgi:hypothetical protein